MGRQNVDIITGYAQNVSIKFDSQEFMNKEIAPILDMKSPKMKIATYNQGDQFRTAAKRREPGTEIETSKRGRSSVNPNTEQYAASDFITREDLRDENLPTHLAPPIDLVQDSLEKNSDELDQGREERLAAHIFAETFVDGVSGGVDVGGTWLTPSTSTFLADFDTAIVLLKKNGVSPKNLRLALDFGTMQKLKRIDDIRDQMKHTSARSLTPEILATILQISKVVVCGAIDNTAQAKAGEDAFTGKYIWEPNAGKGWAMLYNYVKPTKRSLNAVIQARSALDNKQFRLTEQYWDNKKKAWFYDSMEESDIITTATPAAYQWKDTIAD
jgi:hypothetical protein